MSNTRVNPLASAMESSSKYTYGANGAVELKTSGDLRVDKFSSMLQDTTPEQIKKDVQDMIAEANASENPTEYIVDIFLLAFHKRATSKTVNGKIISDGEGCKNIFYEYILELYNYYPDTVASLFKTPAIYTYGYWKDLLNIWVKINELPLDDKTKFSKYDKLIRAFRYAMIKQRSEDINELGIHLYSTQFKHMKSEQFKSYVREHTDELKNVQISNVGKFCVRENTSFDHKAYWYIGDIENGIVREDHVAFMIRSLLRRKVDGEPQMYPVNKRIPFGAKKIWRLDNARLNIVLDVAETHFTGGTWSTINFSRVPSVCLKRHTKALINEHRTNKIEQGSCYDETGNRYPDNEDRVKCRQNFQDFLLSGKKLNSSQLYPHQIYGSTDYAKNVSSMQRKVIQAQWDSLIENIKEKMEITKQTIIDSKIKSTNTKNMAEVAQMALSSGNFLACPDISASMTWVGKAPNRPMDIGLALSAFMSEIASDDWKDLAMAFSSYPDIINMKGVNGRRLDVFERIEMLQRNSGGSTNYLGLHKKLVEICTEKNIKDEDLPVLVVFSDCDFDSGGAIQVNNSYNYDYVYTYSQRNSIDKTTTHEEAVKMWTNAGYKSSPLVIYWNLAASKTSVQAHSKMPGVQLLGGSSASNFKYILHGEMADEITETVEIGGEAVEIKTKDINPWKTFRLAMDQGYFDTIRYILSDSTEGKLIDYNL